MSVYRTQVAALHQAILQQNPEAILPHIKSARADVFPPAARFDVYGFAYAKQLEDATRPDFPALEQYLGEKEMNRLLHAFVLAKPSDKWDLNAYTPQFADYLAQIGYDAAAVALAQLEAAIAHMFWAPESLPMDAGVLASTPPEQLEGMHFTQRSTATLLQFDWAANAYLQAFRDQAPLKQMVQQNEYICVVRHMNRVQRFVLEPLEHRLLKRLFDGKNFAEAFADIPETEAGNISIYLSRWLQHGFFAAS